MQHANGRKARSPMPDESTRSVGDLQTVEIRFENAICTRGGMKSSRHRLSVPQVQHAVPLDPVGASRIIAHNCNAFDFHLAVQLETHLTPIANVSDDCAQYDLIIE